MKTWQIVLLLFLGGAIIGGVIGYGMWHKPHTDYEKQDVDFKVTADALFNELDADEAAIEKYRDKVIQVTGTLEEIGATADGNTTLLLNAENAMMGGVNASMARNYIDEEGYRDQLQGLQPGDLVTLKCRFLGFEKDLITDVKLDNCYIVN